MALIPVCTIWLIGKQGAVHLSIAAFGLALGLTIPLFREIPSQLVNNATKMVARYSYGIYLSHFAIMIFFLSDPSYPSFKYIEPIATALRHHRALYWPLFSLLCVMVSIALYHLIEEPSIRLGKKIARRIVSV